MTKERASIVQRLRDYCTEDADRFSILHPICDDAADEIERLRSRFAEAAGKALTYAESYEMAVARLVLAMDYMHPEQKRAFNAAWAEKRAELLALRPNVEVSG